MAQGLSGISLISKQEITLKNFYGASIPEHLWEEWRAMLPTPSAFSRLETLMLVTLKNVANDCPLPFSSPKTLFIFSTTKGNIDSLPSTHSGMQTLPSLARKVAGVFQNPSSPIVISNACISGLSAILMAKSLLQSGRYEQVVVCGADILSEFTVSGFQCLHAISPIPCKPFDRDRMGLSPGEACGVVVLSNKSNSSSIQIRGGASSNDANHISGPSRTGDGLALAISKALKTADVSAKDIDYVCTHGTATLYNDESESKALALTNLNLVPANSLKGYFGHTFGAAGVIETILTAHSMKNSHILASLGYSSLGVSTEMNIIPALTSIPITHSLKTASGFGSCNAALVLSAA
jgi:3-oxoacyl-[acyl-carrier-protein] synthase-1